MKFLLETTRQSYSEEKAKQLEKIGFSFRKHHNQFLMTNSIVTIEFETIKDLINFCQEYGNIILSSYINENGEEVNMLEIYNDYRE